MSKSTLLLNVPRERWLEVGMGDPKTRLHAKIKINSLDMHLEAIEVTKRKGRQMPKNPEYDDIWDGHIKADDSGSPFLTIKIGRRTYCLFAEPFSQ